jgi:excinuclease ABC subunit A
MPHDQIVIRGARHHNLKNVSLDLPRNRLVVITGLSGSGKSTLAFDTLYAEGQRRYVESLSTYARQFLERLDKPDVDLIEGLSPAIAIEQKSTAHNPRSTVGTVTEIYDYLRLLYARVGQPHCPRCRLPVAAQSLERFIDELLGLPEGTRLVVFAPVVTEAVGGHAALLTRLRKDGFARVRIDGEVREIDEVGQLTARRPHTIEVVVDRLVIRPNLRNRLADSLELAVARADGQATVELPDAGRVLAFSEKAACPGCGATLAELSPASFSFNSPLGACNACDGIGARMEFDPHLLVPNPELSLREGAVAPWAHRSSVRHAEFLDAFTAHYQASIYTPYKDLPSALRQALLYGSGGEPIAFYAEDGRRRQVAPRPYEGLIPLLERRYRETDSPAVRDDLRRYMGFHTCPACEGARLNPESRAVRLGGRSIAEVTALPVTQAIDFFLRLELGATHHVIAAKILKEILDRLRFLDQVGLPYLSLSRRAGTLSGGENQRIRLATQIGSKLSGVLYVLDEPSIGLHPRDNRRLLEALLRMRDLGNSVLVVEHDEETIRAADHVVDMGPGAGVHGGAVVYSGPPQGLLQAAGSLTGDYLAGRRAITVPPQRRSGDGRCLTLRGASANNLREIDVVFPLGTLVGVTGVSGSGKSSLVLETLYPALQQRLHQALTGTAPYHAIEGLEHVDKVVHIDQSSIGRTPRSNPGTYTGVFNLIRDLFARTPEARARGFQSGRFSFNVKGGRCEACGGDGLMRVEMHFLPDVYVTCDVCGGRRYNRETLEIAYKGRHIAEVLDMTVDQALAFFGRIRLIRQRLETLADVGLGYIRLGQPATTLSGGEAQRIKLARELSRPGGGRAVYILDEPTTGLHFEDIRRLLEVLNRLVEAGNTVVVIEHNLDVLKTADHLIDLGPEGGDGGGRIVATGTPEELARHPTSHTGRYLRAVLPASP